MNRPFDFLTAPFRTVLIWLIAVDFGFILIHTTGFLLHRAGLAPEIPSIFVISRDWALPEGFNYLKWLVIIAALLRIALRDHCGTAFAWALVFLMILADDSMQIHETVGWLIGEGAGLQAQFLMEPADQGELVVFGLMGLSVMLLTGFSFARAGSASRKLNGFYAAIIIGLGFFGVGIDLIHQTIVHFSERHPSAEFLKHVFALLEDGGEMLVASVAVAFTLAPPAIGSDIQHRMVGDARPDGRAT